MNKYETPVNELDLCSGMCIHEFEICSTWPDVLVKTLQVIWGCMGWIVQVSVWQDNLGLVLSCKGT